MSARRLIGQILDEDALHRLKQSDAPTGCDLANLSSTLRSNDGDSESIERVQRLRATLF